jgi:hypothetical protein
MYSVQMAFLVGVLLRGGFLGRLGMTSQVRLCHSALQLIDLLIVADGLREIPIASVHPRLRGRVPIHIGISKEPVPGRRIALFIKNAIEVCGENTRDPCFMSHTILPSHAIFVGEVMLLWQIHTDVLSFAVGDEIASDFTRCAG